MPPKVGSSNWQNFDDFVGIVAVDFNVEDIHAGEAFEQNGLPFHDRLGGECADVAQTKDGSPIGHDRDQVAAARVFEGIVRVAMDFQARYLRLRECRPGLDRVECGKAWWE